MGYISSIARPTIIAILAGAMGIIIAMNIVAYSEHSINHYYMFTIKLLSFGLLWFLLDLILPGSNKAYDLIKDYLKKLLSNSN